MVVPHYDIETLRAGGAPEFAQTDTEALKSALIAKFEEFAGRTLYPAQPENYMINLMAYALAGLGHGVNLGLAQNCALWAEGLHLDHKGAETHTQRLGAQYAQTDLQFELTGPQAQAVIIAQGTRVAAGDLIFATRAALRIEPGQVHGQIGADATKPGAAHNGLAPGQITAILDPIAHVSAARNVIPAQGGSDVEGDERYMLRVLGAWEKITRGGAVGGYRQHVLAVHPDIVDVAVIRPEPGHIDLFPLMKNGASTDALDAAILGYLVPDTMIPQGDYVRVKKAYQCVFDVAMTIRTRPGVGQTVKAQAVAAIAAQFAKWAQGLGAQIAPARLVEAVAGLADVVDASAPGFNFTDLAEHEFAALGACDLTFIEAANV